jgi:hypothetical protein
MLFALLKLPLKLPEVWRWLALCGKAHVSGIAESAVNSGLQNSSANQVSIAAATELYCGGTAVMFEMLSGVKKPPAPMA